MLLEQPNRKQTQDIPSILRNPPVASVSKAREYLCTARSRYEKNAHPKHISTRTWK